VPDERFQKVFGLEFTLLRGLINDNLEAGFSPVAGAE